MDVLRQYRSRRNRVCLLRTSKGLAVQKNYPQPERCAGERRVYELLEGSGLPHAALLDSGENWLWLSPLPGKELLTVLEEQESTGRIRREFWERLVGWLIRFHEITGLAMTDVNLRNFLYDPEADMLCGVDFEECGEGDLPRTIGLLAAYIRNYAPEHTPIKGETAECVLQEFAKKWNFPMEALRLEAQEQEKILLNRRKNK